jgi:hypothetical protein
MLLEVQEWIRASKPIPRGGKPEDSPLAIAGGTGFHSLVKLLLDDGEGWSQGHRDAALVAALTGGNVEAARLLLARGAQPAGLNTEALAVCVEAGVDLDTGTPLARELLNDHDAAFAFLERWHGKNGSVSDQGAMALISEVREGEERKVRRLLHAGASPRRRVTELDGRHEPKGPTTAIAEGVRVGTFRILLMLGVRKTDRPQELMKQACWDYDIVKIKHLLQRGAKLNDKDGGSTVLQACIKGRGDWQFRHYGDRAQRAWETAAALAEMGAQWKPDAREMFLARCGLRHTSPETCAEIARVLLKTGAAERAVVVKLFGSMVMREWLTTSHNDPMGKVLGPQWWMSRRARSQAKGAESEG